MRQTILAYGDVVEKAWNIIERKDNWQSQARGMASTIERFRRKRPRPSDDFFPCCGKDLQGWISDGYKADAFQGLATGAATTQQKSYKWSDSEGELDYLAATNGQLDCFRYRPKTPRPNALHIIAEYQFNCGTPNSVIEEYAAFLGKLLFTAESMGGSASLVINCKVRNLCSDNEMDDIQIVVKRQGDPLDFRSFSAMFSPAGFRGLCFTAYGMAADRHGKKANSFLGSADGTNEWTCRKEGDYVYVTCRNSDQQFPKDMMEQAARDNGLVY